MDCAFGLLALVLSLQFVLPAPVDLIPPDWKLNKAADPNELITVTLALKQTNEEWLDSTLHSVSNPDSPFYGRHKTLEEIAIHVHARPKSVTAVKVLFGKVGVYPSFTIGQGLAIANIPVAVAEVLFSAKFYQFQSKLKADTITTRTLEYSIPSSLESHVDFICCMDQFPNLNQSSTLRSYGRPKALQISPASIEKSYNISDYQSTNSNNSQAVAGFLKQYFNPSDLSKFQNQFNVPNNPVVKVIGSNNVRMPGGEASLDLEYITGVGRNVPTWFISVSTYSNGKQEDFLSWLTLLTNTSDAPLVHSGSYGDVESTIDSAYIHRCENEFKKLGISGRTILFAAGDSGTACKRNKFNPNWPASSPSVTSVGGTESMTKVWSSGGGGFSNVFTTPDYQKEAVKAFLNSGKAPDTKYFNSSGRAYPDISAFAIGFIIYVDGMEDNVGGTSCSAPTAAGIVSLLNDVRLNNGMSSVGFLNPLIYKLNGEGFFDVTEGENDDYNPLCGGFKAIDGWDPASGWGSPNFGILKNLVMQ